MELDGRIVRQMILFTLVVLIIPMVIFPERFGTDLVKASFHYALYEFVFYGFVLYFFNRKTKLISLLQAAALCLIFRLGVGAVFGLLIVVMYPMNLSVAISLGMSSYLPGVILHILATPFILKPIYDIQSEKLVKKPMRPESTESMESLQSGSSNFVAKKEPRRIEQPKVATDYSDFHAHRSTQPVKIQSDNGFQNAVSYIGENGSVLMAAVIDTEGLLLSGFNRGNYNPEDLSPLALPLIGENINHLKKMSLPLPEKTEMMFEDKRMIIATEKYYTLVVISERTVDDVLSIRINQGLEMIKMYVAERYSEKLIGNAERLYV